MSRKFTLALLGLALPLLLATAASGREALPQFARIDAAREAGLIDDDQSLLYRFQYVFDGDKVVASYNFGNTLAVDRAYRRQGIGEELVYQWRTRNPNAPPARERTKAASRRCSAPYSSIDEWR